MSVALSEAQGYPSNLSLASSLNVRMFTIHPFANFLLTSDRSLAYISFTFNKGDVTMKISDNQKNFLKVAAS